MITIPHDQQNRLPDIPMPSGPVTIVYRSQWVTARCQCQPAGVWRVSYTENKDATDAVCQVCDTHCAFTAPRSSP